MLFDGLINISQISLIDMALLSVGANPLMRTSCTATTTVQTNATATAIHTATTTVQTNLTYLTTVKAEYPPANPNASKSRLAVAVSLSIIGLLLVILLAVVVVIFKRRRYHVS